MFFVYLLEGTEPLVTRCTSRWLGVHFTLSPWCNQLLSWTLDLFALYCSLVTVAKAPDQIWKMFWRASAMNWFLLLECFVPKHFFIYICIYIYIYIHTYFIFMCVYIYTSWVTAAVSCTDNPSGSVWMNEILPVLVGTFKAALMGIWDLCFGAWRAHGVRVSVVLSRSLTLLEGFM